MAPVMRKKAMEIMPMQSTQTKGTAVEEFSTIATTFNTENIANITPGNKVAVKMVFRRQSFPPKSL
eukprot:evm.model.NODE_23253_length_10832_cov_27.199778.1